LAEHGGLGAGGKSERAGLGGKLAHQRGHVLETGRRGSNSARRLDRNLSWIPRQVPGKGHTPATRPTLLTQSISQKLCVSAALTNPKYKDVYAWLESSADSIALMNVVLMLIHPAQYLCMTLARRWVLSQSELLGRESRILDWNSVFSGISAIINRMSKPHKDSNGHPFAYDVLTCIGSANSQAMFRIDTLGATFDYSRGTIVALTTRRLLHSVPRWAYGDRVCISAWFREFMLKVVPGMSEDDLQLPREEDVVAALEALRVD
jgi:hypothetical protein